jgi:hypothetical protein
MNHPIFRATSRKNLDGGNGANSSNTSHISCSADSFFQVYLPKQRTVFGGDEGF